MKNGVAEGVGSDPHDTISDLSSTQSELAVLGWTVKTAFQRALTLSHQ